MKAEIQRCKKKKKKKQISVMPQMGVEYRLEPTDEQVKLYHKMIDWGAKYYLWRSSLMWLSLQRWLKDGAKRITYSMGILSLTSEAAL